VNALLLARPAPGCRHALLDNRYTVRGLDGRGESRVLRSAEELRQTLEDAFRLTLPPHPKLDERLQQLARSAG
jgi:N-hydroxyarylamine O-acetyltransferase